MRLLTAECSPKYILKRQWPLTTGYSYRYIWYMANHLHTHYTHTHTQEQKAAVALVQLRNPSGLRIRRSKRVSNIAWRRKIAIGLARSCYL